MEMAFLEKVSQFDTYGAEMIVVKVIQTRFSYKNKTSLIFDVINFCYILYSDP